LRKLSEKTPARGGGRLLDSRSGVEAKGEDREKDKEEGREAASATI
jgi:hypothetical protein